MKHNKLGFIEIQEVADNSQIKLNDIKFQLYKTHVSNYIWNLLFTTGFHINKHTELNVWYDKKLSMIRNEQNINSL